jgi:hypothetical protein
MDCQDRSRFLLKVEVQGILRVEIEEIGDRFLLKVADPKDVYEESIALAFENKCWV